MSLRCWLFGHDHVSPGAGPEHPVCVRCGHTLAVTTVLGEGAWEIRVSDVPAREVER